MGQTKQWECKQKECEKLDWYLGKQAIAKKIQCMLLSQNVQLLNIILTLSTHDSAISPGLSGG